MSYDRYIEPRRRLAFLCLLSYEKLSALPLRQLRDKLNLIGYPESIDRIRTDAAWLSDQGLVDVELANVALTERGQEVVDGLVITPGVTPPKRGEVDELRRLLVAAAVADVENTLRGG